MKKYAALAAYFFYLTTTVSKALVAVTTKYTKHAQWESILCVLCGFI
ncbi:hypothetical protein KADA111694_03540 [Kaistella daneshvariae]